MAREKLSRDELAYLGRLGENIQNQKAIVRALELSAELWKLEKLKDKGIDTTKPHEINLHTGHIRVLATEEKPKDGNEGD